MLSVNYEVQVIREGNVYHHNLNSVSNALSQYLMQWHSQEYCFDIFLEYFFRGVPHFISGFAFKVE